MRDWNQIGSPECLQKFLQSIIRMVWKLLWVKLPRFLLGAELHSCEFLIDLRDFLFGLVSRLITTPSNVYFIDIFISTVLSINYVA